MVNNKVALLGFGVVGKAFYEIVKNKRFGGEDIDIKFIYVRTGKAEGYNKDYDTAYVRMKDFDTRALVTTVYMIYERYRKIKNNGVQYQKRRRRINNGIV